MPGMELEEQIEVSQTICPQWHVIFLNDDYHSFEFVILCIIQIFRKDFDEALALTTKIHHEGQAIITTCTKERAELYLEQVSSMKEGAKGSIGCVIEPAE